MKAKVIIVAVLAIVIIAVWAMNTHLHKRFKSDPAVEFTQILSDISYWPGKRITTSKNIEGKRWYYQTYQLTSPENYINLVESNTAGKQTVDITGLRSDSLPLHYRHTGWRQVPCRRPDRRDRNWY